MATATEEKIETFEAALDEVIARARKVMIDRQRKYGSGNIDRHKELGLRVRIDDKLERIAHSGDQNFEDDSILDPWLDIANYALIGMMLTLGIWGHPLTDDAADARKSIS